MTGPLVSIGVPVYNGARTIEHCLESLLAQSYRNIEIVVSDNASTDATPQICQRIAARDARVRYCRNDRNIGMFPNFNRALQLSTGEFFTWACADDVRPAGAIQSCVEALLHNPQAVMAHGPICVKLKDATDLVVFDNRSRLNQSSAADRVRSFAHEITHNSMIYGLYRRSAVQRAVFGDCYGQDYLLSLQMCFLGPIEYVETPIIVYAERKTTRSTSRMYSEMPVTLGALLKEGGMRRRKCWTVLLLGCYFGLTRPGVPFGERVSGASVHASLMFRLYGKRLGKEVLFQTVQPLSLLGIATWKLFKRQRLGSWIARMLQAVAPSVAPRRASR